MIRPVQPRPFWGTVLAGLLVCAAFCPAAFASEPITPIPTHIDYNRPKALLGRTLFLDPILSLDRTISCASCHDLAAGGCDSSPVSTGVKGRQGEMNAPTIFNAVFNFRQFWNGRSRGLSEQADGPIHNPLEMGMDTAEVEQRLNADASYRQTFHKVYPKDRVEFTDVLDAIAEFEKALITPDSRFDRYLRGEIELNAAEKKGYLTFKELGCITCHNGVNVGGNSFQKVGVINPFSWNGKLSDRFKLTGDERDKNVYKVPSLRNIDSTAPYFHDGSQKTLQQALKAMSFHNLGLDLTAEEERTLTAFLKSLTGLRPEILADGPRPTGTLVSAPEGE
jgi:cytochrome c peroxidase